MPREIKYRTWFELEKKMLNWKDIGWKEMNDQIRTHSLLSGEYAYFKPMQYTGLKDRNGVEIYESDIIQYDNERYEVYWSEDWAMFTVKGCQVQALMRYASFGEVVGNVHILPKEDAK